MQNRQALPLVGHPTIDDLISPRKEECTELIDDMLLSPQKPSVNMQLLNGGIIR